LRENDIFLLVAGIIKKKIKIAFVLGRVYDNSIFWQLFYYRNLILGHGNAIKDAPQNEGGPKTDPVRQIAQKMVAGMFQKSINPSIQKALSARRFFVWKHCHNALPSSVTI
jgi:hypothetical protein